MDIFRRFFSGSVPTTPEVVPSVVVQEVPPSDPKEAWSERVDIITKEEHEEYVGFAKDFVKELAEEVPARSVVESRGAVESEAGKLTVEKNPEDTDVSEYESADDASVASPLTSPLRNRKGIPSTSEGVPSSTSSEYFTVSSSAPRSSEAFGTDTQGQDTAPPSSSATPLHLPTIPQNGLEESNDEVFIVDLETNRTVSIDERNLSFGNPAGFGYWDGDYFGAGIPVSTPKHNLLDTSHLTDFVLEAGGENKPRRSSLYRIDGSPLVALSPVPQLKRPLFIEEEEESECLLGDVNPDESKSKVQKTGNPDLNVTAHVVDKCNITVPVIDTPEERPINATPLVDKCNITLPVIDTPENRQRAINGTFDNEFSPAEVLNATYENDVFLKTEAGNATYDAAVLPSGVNTTFDSVAAPPSVANATFDSPASSESNEATQITTVEKTCEAPVVNPDPLVLNQTSENPLSEFSLRVGEDSYAFEAGQGFVSAQSFGFSLGANDTGLDETSEGHKVDDFSEVVQTLNKTFEKDNETLDESLNHVTPGENNPVEPSSEQVKDSVYLEPEPAEPEPVNPVAETEQDDKSVALNRVANAGQTVEQEASDSVKAVGNEIVELLETLAAVQQEGVASQEESNVVTQVPEIVVSVYNDTEVEGETVENVSEKAGSNAQSDTTLEQINPVAEPLTVSVATEPTTVSVATEPTTVSVATEPTTVFVATEPTTVVAATEPTAVSVATEPTTVSVATEPTTVSVATEPTTVSVATEPTTVSVATEPTTVSAATEPTTVSVATEPVAVSISVEPAAERIQLSDQHIEKRLTEEVPVASEVSIVALEEPDLLVESCVEAEVGPVSEVAVTELEVEAKSDITSGDLELDPNQPKEIGARSDITSENLGLDPNQPKEIEAKSDITSGDLELDPNQPKEVCVEAVKDVTADVIADIEKQVGNPVTAEVKVTPLTNGFAEEIVSAPEPQSVNVDDIPLIKPISATDGLDDLPLPKKGYDLSWLDSLQDAENAVPNFEASLPSEVKQPVKSAKNVKSRLPAKKVVIDNSGQKCEPVEKVVSETSSVDSQKLAPESVQTKTAASIVESKAPQVESAPEELKTETAKPPPKKQIRRPPSKFVRPKPVPKASEDIEILLPKSDTADLDDLPLPKKGYDLSFLDKLDDIENASPNSVKATDSRSTGDSGKIVEKVTEKDAPTKVEKSSAEPKPSAKELEPVVEVAVAAQAPSIVEAPLESGLEVTEVQQEDFVVEDLTEKQKLDRIVALQEESLAPSEEEILAQEAASVCEEIFNLSRHLEDGEMAEADSNNRNTDSNVNMNTTQSPQKLDTRTFKKPSSRAPQRKSVIPSESRDEVFSDPSRSSPKLAEDSFSCTMTSDELRKLQEATAHEQFVSGSTDLFTDPSALDFLSEKGGRKKTIAQNSLYTNFDPIVAAAQRAAPDGTENPSEPTASLVMFSPKKDAQMVQTAAPMVPRENINIAEAPGGFITEQRHREMVMLMEQKQREMMRTLELNYQDRLLKAQRELQECQKELEVQRHKVVKAQETESQVQVIINEYESVINELTSKSETLRSETQHQADRLKEEVDMSTADLRKTERAFNDMMQKYERTKSAMEVLQANEEVLKNAVEQYNKQIDLEKQKTKLLKESLSEKLENTLINHKKEIETAHLEISRLNALLKRSTLKTSQLENANEMLKKANEELTSICDGLVAQMSN